MYISKIYFMYQTLHISELYEGDVVWPGEMQHGDQSVQFDWTVCGSVTPVCGGSESLTVRSRQRPVWAGEGHPDGEEGRATTGLSWRSALHTNLNLIWLSPPALSAFSPDTKHVVSFRCCCVHRRQPECLWSENTYNSALIIKRSVTQIYISEWRENLRGFMFF